MSSALIITAYYRFVHDSVYCNSASKNVRATCSAVAPLADKVSLKCDLNCLVATVPVLS